MRQEATITRQLRLSFLTDAPNFLLVGLQSFGYKPIFFVVPLEHGRAPKL
jgi:hypothetical protein